MLISTTSTRMHLERGQSTRLSDLAEARLTSAAGTLWVTIDNDPRDIVLEAGEGFDVSGGEPLLVFALGGPAMLDLRPQPTLAQELAEAL